MFVRRYEFHDSLYGSVRLDEQLSALAMEPLVQRLRHVRLSNIDSIDIPGIANLSRFEHVLGVAYLSSHVAFRARLSRFDDLVLRASALLHDWAITAFGHLVEEALQYVGTAFDHQERLNSIASGEAPEEILGVGRQILVGRETGLLHWVSSVTHSEAEGGQLLAAITEHIRGKGLLGRVICGDIDLDNIDNVFRMAYHMGLHVETELPVRLVSSIVDYNSAGAPVFRRTAMTDIEIWRRTRSTVYEHLMLAGRDFVGKTMMLYAAIRAFESGEIRIVDWNMTDIAFVNRLLSSGVYDTKEAVERWSVGELWDFTPIQWMDGERPDYTRIGAFSVEVSKKLDRKCFAYGIKDKRDRRLSISFDDGSTEIAGATPHRWLLGAGSPERRPFSAGESAALFEFARAYLGTRVIGPAASDSFSGREIQPSLL